MDFSLFKRVFLESFCVLIFFIIVYLWFYKEVKDVKEDEESYDWINRLDVVLLVMLMLIVVFSFFVESDWDDFIWLGFYIFVDFLVYIFLLVCVMVVVRSVRKYCCEVKRDKENSVLEFFFFDVSDFVIDIIQ